VAKKRNQKNVVVSSAFDLEADQLEKIKIAMQKRLEADIIISSTIDETLIGGMKISYEDQVIDLSLKNKLESLKAQLRN
jgi:F-type H+-transporting ATPase subunit delta